MGSPAIFSGLRTKLLTSSGALYGSNQTTLDYNGPINYIQANPVTALGNWVAASEVQNPTITIASPGVFTTTSTTGYYNGMPIIFTTSGALPTGITSGTTYYITNLGTDGANKYRVSTSLGGADVNTTGSQSGTHAGRPLVPITGAANAVAGLTLSRNTTTPLNTIVGADFKLTQTNSTVVAGQGANCPFTIDTAFKGAALSVSFQFNASSNFTPSTGQTGSFSDLMFWIYDATNAAVIPVSPAVITANGTNNWTFKGIFQASSTSTSYKLCIIGSTGNAPATGFTFNWVNVYVGPQPQPLGPTITDPVSVTPTFTGLGTVTSINIRSWREGAYLNMEGNFTSGTTTATEARISLAFNGGTVTSSSILPTGTSIIGNWVRGTSAANHGGMILAEANVAYVTFSDSTVFSNTASDATSKTQGPMGNNTLTSFFFSIPIAGWSGTSLMSNDASTRPIVAHYKCTSGFVTSTTTPINYDTIVFDNAGAVTPSATVWKFIAPIAGWYRASITNVANAASAQNLALYKNGVLYAALVTFNTTNTTGGSQSVQLAAGDFIDVRGSASLTLANASDFNQISIELIQGPSTISTIDSINARYFASATSISGSLATVSWTTKDYDTANAMSAGVYTIGVAGKYQINSALLVAGTVALNSTLILEIQKNSTVVSRYTLYAGGIETNLKGLISDIINCLAGDLIRIQVSTSVTGPSIVSSNFDNYFSIARLGN